MKNNIKKILINKSRIKKKVKKLGALISHDFYRKELIIICVLRGASIFFADLVRELTIPVQIDFITMSSYGAKTQSSGEIKITKDFTLNIEQKNILIIEDIIDSGYTMTYLMEHLSAKNPSSIKVCALLDKPSSRKTAFQADYLGFSIPDEFVIGYGLDYNENYRNLPDICILDTDNIK